MKQMLQAYGHSKDTVTIILMVYKNSKAVDCLLESETKFFSIVTGVLIESIDVYKSALITYYGCQEFL